MTSVGTQAHHARSLAEVLVEGDHRGHYSHGLNRMGQWGAGALILKKDKRKESAIRHFHTSHYSLFMSARTVFKVLGYIPGMHLRTIGPFRCIFDPSIRNSVARTLIIYTYIYIYIELICFHI